MTKTEEAELAELNMTPEEIAGRQAKIAQLLNGQTKVNMTITGVDTGITALRDAGVIATRKPRSDKGIPKGPKKPPESGVLSPQQAARLRDLIDLKQSRLAELDAIKAEREFLAVREAQALDRIDAADAELEAYLLELQGK